MTGGERLGGDRRGSGMQRDVDHGAMASMLRRDSRFIIILLLDLRDLSTCGAKSLFASRAVPDNSPTSLRSNALDPAHDELSDTRAARNDKRICAMIYQDDPDFATVIGVDRPGSIKYGDAEFERQPRARP